MNLQQLVDHRAPGAAPAGHQVEARHCFVSTVAAAGDVVEKTFVVRSDPDVVETRIQKAQGGLSLGSFLLIRQRREAGPLRSSKAGPTIPSGATSVKASPLIGVRFGGDIRVISQGSGPLIRGIDDSRQLLIAGNWN